MMRYLLFVSLLFTTVVLSAQDLGVDSLNAQVDDLERRVSELSEKFSKPVPEDKNFTRGNIEALNVKSSVKTDVSGLELSVGGFIQTDMIFDFYNTSNRYGFQNYSINMEDFNRDPELTYSVKQTRLSFSSDFITKSGIEIFTIFEMDFFNINSLALEVRHAYGEINGIGVGQYWSNFMEIETFPNILDYWGPNSMIFARPIQLRYSIPLKEKNNKLVVSIEQVAPDLIYEETPYKSWNISPNYTASYKHYFNKTFVKGALLFHPITYEDTLSVEKYFNAGFGINLTSNIYTLKNNHFSIQASWLDGATCYVNDLGGQGYDAFFNGQTNRFDNNKALAFYCYYNHWLSNKISTSIGISHLQLYTSSSNTNQLYNNSTYGSVNCILYPWNTVKVGIEYIYGNLNYSDGRMGINHRIQASFMFKI